MAEYFDEDDTLFGERRQRLRQVLDELQAFMRRLNVGEHFEPDEWRSLLDKAEMASLLTFYLARVCHGRAKRAKPPRDRGKRNEMLRRQFLASGLTINAFAVENHGLYNLSGHQIRRLLSEWKCATNAQPERREA
jgi:hypothetical protein